MFVLFISFTLDKKKQCTSKYQNIELGIFTLQKEIKDTKLASTNLGKSKYEFLNISIKHIKIKMYVSYRTKKNKILNNEIVQNVLINDNEMTL